MLLRSLFLASAVLLGAQPPHTETRTEPLAMGAKLWISQEDGRVDIQGWDRPEVELVAEFVPGSGRDEPRLEVRRDPEGLRVEVHYKHRFHFTLFGSHREPVINLTLKVPRRLSMDVRSVDGNITVADLEGYAGCTTVDGDIQVQGIRGEVHARAVDGDITARDLKARLKGGTVDGKIVLERVEGGVDLGTVDGSITAEALEGWGEGITLHTVDGDIHLKLGQAKGQLEAHSTGGAIRTHLSGSTTTGPASTRFTCTLPGRDQKISLRTVDGDIEVD